MGVHKNKFDFLFLKFLQQKKIITRTLTRTPTQDSYKNSLDSIKKNLILYFTKNQTKNKI